MPYVVVNYCPSESGKQRHDIVCVWGPYETEAAADTECERMEEEYTNNRDTRSDVWEWFRVTELIDP